MSTRFFRILVLILGLGAMIVACHDSAGPADDCAHNPYQHKCYQPAEPCKDASSDACKNPPGGDREPENNHHKNDDNPQDNAIAQCIQSFAVAADATDLCVNEHAQYGAIADTIALAANTAAYQFCDGPSVDATDSNAMEALRGCIACNIAADHDISAACASCDGAVAACVITACYAPCIGQGANQADCDVCRRDAQCEANLEACTGITSAGEGEACTTDDACKPYACDTSKGVCFKTCVGNEQCAGARICDDNGTCTTADTGDVSTWDRVLIVSRTPATGTNDCRAPNPGPDIDTVALISNAIYREPTMVTGSHGRFCGAAAPSYWAEPSATLTRDAIPSNIPGTCTLNASSQDLYTYFFMGTGQPYTPNETIEPDTGYLVAHFGQPIMDGDQIQVLEVNDADSDGNVICTNISTVRLDDIYGVYLVSSHAADIAPGTVLEAPDFLRISAAPTAGIGTFDVALTP